MEFAWKSHISLLFPGPKEFTAFMGEGLATLLGLRLHGIRSMIPFLVHSNL